MYASDIRSFEDWCNMAMNLGYQGPYTLHGSCRGQQFIYRTGGTAAIWDAEKKLGYVFDPPTLNGKAVRK